MSLTSSRLPPMIHSMANRKDKTLIARGADEIARILGVSVSAYYKRRAAGWYDEWDAIRVGPNGRLWGYIHEIEAIRASTEESR